MTSKSTSLFALRRAVVRATNESGSFPHGAAVTGIAVQATQTSNFYESKSHYFLSASQRTSIMADTKLRCALVYRLEDSPILIAKYDHASQYETHGGTDQGTLYGGRDKNYADAVGKIIGSDPPGGLSEAGAIGGFKIVQSDVHQVVYGSDTDGICKSTAVLRSCSHEYGKSLKKTYFLLDHDLL
jgi:hypothetical protein